MTKEPCSVESLAEALKLAQKFNYQIVPIVGAGLSADCGIPIITSVVRYFGKLRSYIRSGMGLPNSLMEIPDIKNQFLLYEEQPWRFIEDFGWPDRFQLNDDLVSQSDTQKSVDDLVREGLDSMVPFLNVPGLKAFEQLREDIKLIDHKEWPKIEATFGSNWGKSRAFDVVGDWRRLILYFTNHQSDYADSLFARFGANRQPSLGHRFLTFLIKLFAIPTTFTFNFDSMIEQALQSEGATPRVFGMERGAGLPHSQLTRGQISVIKMHGNTHALLLDEDLDHPLSRPYLERFDQLTSVRPLLLVVGCSDGDRRLRDIVSYVLKKRERSEKRITDQVPTVIWLHYESDPPQFLGGENNHVLTYKTNNPGATLQHVYSYLTTENPAGRRFYLAHVQQPVHLGRNWSDNTSIARTSEKIKFELIKSGEAMDNPWLATPSYSLLNRGNYFAKSGFHFIWVDLEALHTLAGVVASIIDQCRKYDPALAPSLLPFNLDGNEPEDAALVKWTKVLAAKRVARALRGTRFYVAFDSLEKFVSPATTHHGLTHMAVSKGAESRLKHLVDFLNELTKPELNLGESKIGVSVDTLQTRHYEDNLNEKLDLEERVKELEIRFIVRDEKLHFPVEKYFYELNDYPITSLLSLREESDATSPVSELLGSDGVTNELRFTWILFNLSCFRRTRPLVALRCLIAPIMGSLETPEKVDKLLSVFEEPISKRKSNFQPQWDQSPQPLFLKQLEGGGYWFNHSIRDFVYSRNTRHTNGSSLTDCLSEETENREEKWRKTVFQLWLSAITHERIAHTWYSQTFVQSHDSYAFLEFTYHRISSIRSVTKLRALCEFAQNSSLADPFIDGFVSCTDFLKQMGDGVLPPYLLENCNLLEPMDCNETRSKGSKEQRIKCISETLLKRHWSDLITLHRSWSRAETLLRSQLPGEQLLHWCDELLKDDLVYRCNQLVTSYKSLGGEYEPVTNANRVIDQELENGPISNFRDYLRDLQAKIWTERSDHATCIKNRDDEIRESTQKTLGQSQISLSHKRLDIENSKFKSIQEQTLTDTDLNNDRTSVLRQLTTIEEELTLDSRPSPLISSEQTEAYLRLLHIRTDCELGHVSAFTHDGFSGDPRKWAPAAFNLDAARTTIERAFEIINNHDVQIPDAPRSVTLDPTVDRDLYQQYRSIFHMLKGRIEWLDAPGSSIGFNRAARQFEIARAGSNRRGHLLSALIELYAAEAFLAQGRGVLFQGESIDIVPQLHDLTGAALGRARQFLLASRGHMQGRKFFFRLTAQYYSERLMLNFVDLSEATNSVGSSSVRSSVARISKHSLGVLQRGYLSLVSALDLYLPTSADEFPNSIRWMYRIWLELTLTAYLIGNLTIKTFSNQSSKANEQLLDLIRSLNKTGGIVDSYLGPKIEDDYASFKELSDEIRNDKYGLPASIINRKDRPELRYRTTLIKLVADRSSDPH